MKDKVLSLKLKEQFSAKLVGALQAIVTNGGAFQSEVMGARSRRLEEDPSSSTGVEVADVMSVLDNQLLPTDDCNNNPFLREDCNEFEKNRESIEKFVRNFFPESHIPGKQEDNKIRDFADTIAN